MHDAEVLRVPSHLYKHFSPTSLSKIGLKVKALNQFESDGEASASSIKLTLSADLRLIR